ncbi:uncharacterized protein LOC116988133 isoform X1 [Amblyraja radiata]|uniref:uncharacterized protein LOC116988133 isoform X1 n=1 Tax=Amblyraja radiata TaxID=386614 RepID=UPI0014032AE7|nr:uncharacterized protein LOC116988133 isoform X1 [Amblyraja radiata]XP_032900533.1 uncharacterized protein LOC116988133 isoform X1 [Amblyraja radiata]XP_032900535.1 uncharacterized protein LOC116988133 isoform X1 [Amblyraja radiata]
MDLCLTFYLYFILHLCVPSAETFVHLDCDKSVTGILHEDTILPCRTDETGPIDITLIKLHQNRTRDEKLISISSENVRRSQDRIQLRCQDELRCQHDLSLIIHKTELSDNGTYQYALYANHGHTFFYITLIVEAFVTLVCNESVTGKLLEDTTLPCKTDTTGPTNITLIKLHQDPTRDETLIFNSSENVRGGQDRIQLRHQDPYDLSLIIHKTELSDNGTYRYTVHTDHGHDFALITLIVEESVYSNAALGKPEDKERTGVGLILSMVFLMLLIFSAMFYYKKWSSRASIRRFSETSRSNLIAN